MVNSNTCYLCTACNTRSFVGHTHKKKQYVFVLSLFCSRRIQSRRDPAMLHRTGYPAGTRLDHPPPHKGEVTLLSRFFCVFVCSIVLFCTFLVSFVAFFDDNGDTGEI